MIPRFAQLSHYQLQESKKNRKSLPPYLEMLEIVVASKGNKNFTRNVKSSGAAFGTTKDTIYVIREKCKWESNEAKLDLLWHALNQKIGKK